MMCSDKLSQVKSSCTSTRKLKRALPSSRWDSETLASPEESVRHKQGRLLGKMETLGFDLRAKASLSFLTADVVSSSAIEGESNWIST